MSKTRQRSLRRSGRFPDGPVWIRTHPVNYLHDRTDAAHHHDWHQLSFALRGQLEIETEDVRRLVPADRAVWVPAGTAHSEVMRAPVSVRSLYVAPGAIPGRFDASRCRTLAVSPLLRELILHITRIGALDRRTPEQARLIGVLLDLLAAAGEVGLELRMPRDPRARRFVALISEEPGEKAPIRELATRAGASLRTLERSFLAETGVAVGEWRRRHRLFHALRLLEAGAGVTTVAFEVGYATVSAFSTAFSRQFGASPSRRGRASR